MLAFDLIAENRILQAIARGDFDDLPGAGRPLALDEDPLSPPETSIAHRILRNAGFVPVEVLQRAEIARLEAILSALSADERARTIVKVALLRTHLCGRKP